MDILNLIISLVSGVVGGNVAGSAMSEKNLGPLVNTIAGLVGGGLGNFILTAFGFLTSTGLINNAATAAPAATGTEFDIASLLGNIAASGVSGGALTAIISLIKNNLEKK